MAKYAKVNKSTGVVMSVNEYGSQAPQVSDHERSEAEFVEISNEQSVQVGQPLPAEARVNQSSMGQGQQAQQPGGQSDQSQGSRSTPPRK